MKFKQLKVVGVGAFPIDMLRYDSCWPATQADSLLVADDELRTVTLETISGFEITPERWKSFGWLVKS